MLQKKSILVSDKPITLNSLLRNKEDKTLKAISFPASIIMN